MKTLLYGLALVGLLVPLAACETYSDTVSENRVRVDHAAALNLRGVNDDTERIFYLERPVWLSRYPIPND